MRSCRYLSGSFYTADLKRIVLTPISREEYDVFKQIIENAETKVTRLLSDNELSRVAEYVEDRSRRIQ